MFIAADNYYEKFYCIEDSIYILHKKANCYAKNDMFIIYNYTCTLHRKDKSRPSFAIGLIRQKNFDISVLSSKAIWLQNVQNQIVIFDKSPSTFDTWFGVYIL